MEDKENNTSDKENEAAKAETPSDSQTPIGTKPKPSRKLKRKIVFIVSFALGIIGYFK